ncbi:glycogen phosphorylase: muscle form-like protein [Leptotrombidium deliense]|uniref:Alpha-1,4 glucan phosphorylase n=1 Tax=Leptotrombidium deliense TaxID=299467 RepID=A0A443RVM9_9ACAR|nr:glycogen phosphorylase: muscle form-like protein [Leptotrombidium deliense]
MTRFAIVGSKSVNEVSKKYSDIIRNETFKDFYELIPEKFNNKTNVLELLEFVNDCNFVRQIHKVKLKNKKRLAKIVEKDFGVTVNRSGLKLRNISESFTYNEKP